MGQYRESLEHYQRAVKIFLNLGERENAAGSLSGLGIVYLQTGKYYQAIEVSQQSLNLFADGALALNNLGLAYGYLGQYEKSLKFHQQVLGIRRARRATTSVAFSLTNTGVIYNYLSRPKEAFRAYQEAFIIFKKFDNFLGQAVSLNGMGETYNTLGQYSKAMKIFQESLKIAQRANSLRIQGNILDNIGASYSYLNQDVEALDFYGKALFIHQKINNREGEARTLADIGELFNKQGQVELSIVFLKQSVGIYESIREKIPSSQIDLQETYSQSVAGIYRSLADVLIHQGRLPEAQAVLELLKLRELRDFTRDAGINSPGISLAKIEEEALNQILKQFTTLGNFGQEIAKCEQTKCANLTQLEQQRDTLYTAVNQELKQQRAILVKHFSSEVGSLTPEKLNAEARRIVNAQPGTVLIYPLVLKDKMQFLVAFQAGNGAVVFRPFETKVTAEQLFKTIKTFREQLGETTVVGTPKADLATVQATSQQLYTWLIKPLEAELNAANIKHLVFAPDSTTRYIPLAALYDGKQYLIQRFTVSTITAASKTDTEAKVPRPTGNQPMLLAMGASTFPNLNPLTNVPAELDAITRTNQRKDIQGIYPGSEFLNTSFDYDTLKANLKTGTYRILHLATHGAFKAGRPEDSYLVPGRGQNLTTELIDQLGNYGLGNIHLVVLSACETAVGDRASDGMEIPGISYFFLKNDVKAVMASLWNVNDASTALIMQQFYLHIGNGMTKAQALQQVQQNLIDGKFTAKDAPTRSDIIVTGAPARSPKPPNFAHPYYWAPFILIGNSL